MKHANIQEFIDSLEDEDKQIVDELRRTIKDAIPGVREVIKWSTLTYDKDEETLGAIMVHKDHVNLQLWRGAELEDPTHMLEGSGKGMRHVKVVTLEDARRPGLKAILMRAGKLC